MWVVVLNGDWGLGTCAELGGQVGLAWSFKMEVWRRDFEPLDVMSCDRRLCCLMSACFQWGVVVDSELSIRYRSLHEVSWLLDYCV